MATPEQLEELTRYYESRLASPAHARQLAEINQDRPLARLQGNAAPILARLSGGEKLAQIADSLGISAIALGTWLLEYAPEAYRSISAGRALVNMEGAEGKIEGAETMLDVAKGRELGKLAGWHLERLAKQFAPPGKDQGGGVNIVVNVDRSCAGEVIVDQSPQ